MSIEAVTALQEIAKAIDGLGPDIFAAGVVVFLGLLFLGFILGVRK